jgi:hypothetical protein
MNIVDPNLRDINMWLLPMLRIKAILSIALCKMIRRLRIPAARNFEGGCTLLKRKGCLREYGIGMC